MRRNSERGKPTAEQEEVSYERTLKINAMVGSGATKPTELSPAESFEWEQAAKFCTWAREKDIVVTLPSA